MADKNIVVNIDMNSNKIKNLDTPTDANDAATKGYVDGFDGEPNVVNVPSEYATISAALAYILTQSPSTTNRFIIRVSAGIFTEPFLDVSLTPYTSIVGSAIQPTIIEPDAANHHVMNIGVHNEISFLTIRNAGAGYAGIMMDDTGAYGQAHKVELLDCDINIWIRSATQDTFFYGEYIDYGGTYSIGTKIEATNGFVCFANLENYYNLPSGGTPIGTYVTGIGADCRTLAQGHIGVGAGSAFYLEDGGFLQIVSCEQSAFDFGVHVGNVGATPTLIINGLICAGNTTYDLFIEDATTTGSINASVDITKVLNTSVLMGLLLQGTNDGSLSLNGGINGYFGSYLTDISTLLIGGSGMGLLAGGTISDGGGLDVGVDAGVGYLTKSTGELVKVIWGANTIAIPDNSQRYIYYNQSEVLSVSASFPSSTENIILGVVGSKNGTIEFISNTGVQAANPDNKFDNTFRRGFGAIYSSGSIVSENATPFHVDITGGLYFISSNELIPTGGTDIALEQYYDNGAGYTVGSSALVNHTQYNTGGTLVALTAGYYAKHSLYTTGVGGDEKYFLVIAQAQYATLIGSQEAALPTPPSYFTGAIILIGSIIIKQGAANITEFRDNRPILGSRPETGSSTSDHLSLTNLNTGDAGHNQFMMLDGSTPMAGNLDMGGNSITNVVGNALTKTDDTNITLTLGGSHATALLNALSLTLGWTGQLSVTRGGTGSNLSATGGAGQVLKQTSVGGSISVSLLSASELSNGVTGSGAVVLAVSPTLTTPLLGTPTSGVLTNCTGLPLSALTGLAAGIATWLGTPSSANLLAALTDKTGTGLNVFAISPTLTTPIIGVATGTSLAVTGLLKSSSPSAGIGYATGAGGSVTQATNKSTAVTLNTICGRVVMNNASLGLLATVAFTLNNSSIAIDDVVVVNVRDTGGYTGTNYTVTTNNLQSGLITIRLTNLTGGSLSDAVEISFAIIKAVIS